MKANPDHVKDRREWSARSTLPIILLLLVGSMPLVSSAHLTWNESLSLSLGSSAQFAQNRGDGTYSSLSNSSFLLGYVEADRTGVYKCTFFSCSTSTTLYGDTGNAIGQISPVTEQVVLSCTTDNGLDDVFVQRSTNGGTLWSNAAALTTVLIDPENCAVASFDGSNITVVSSNGFGEVADNARTAYSTDGGQTWSTAADMDTVVTDTADVGVDLAIVAFSDTSYSALHVSQTDILRECYTTVSAVWTCRDIIGAPPTIGFDYKRFGTSGYACWADSVTDDVTFGFLSAISEPWVTTGAVTLSSTLVSVCHIAVFDSQHLGIVYSTDADDTDTGQLLYYTESTNGGSTWSTPELVFTGDVTDSSSPGSHVVGLQYAGSFDRVAAVVIYAQDTDDDDALSAADETVWSVSTTFSGADATAAVTDLNGFGIDPKGQFAIARVGLGEEVKTWNALSLGSPIVTIDTDCAVGTNDFADGVMLQQGTQSVLMLYLACTAGGDQNQVRIRVANGDIPTVDDFDGCTPAANPDSDYTCTYDIPLDQWGEDEIENSIGQLGQVAGFPIDYSHTENVGFFAGTTLREMAFAFSTQQCDVPPGPSYCDFTEPGRVGVAMRTESGAEDSNGDLTEIHHPTQDVNDFCMGLDGSIYYLASAATSQPSKTWQVVFDPQADGPGAQLVLDATIPTPGTSIGAGALGVACGGGQILLYNEDGTVTLHTREGSLLDTASVTFGGIVRGVALSEEFVGNGQSDPDLRGQPCTTATEGTGFCVQYGVYVDSLSEARVINVTGGNIVVVGEPLALPLGDFHSIKMDRAAQNVWVASTTTINRYLVVESTTTDPVTLLPPGAGEPPPTDGPGEGQISSEEIQAFLESKVFWGVILTLLLAMFGFYLAPAGSKGIGAMLGAALGFTVSAFIGWFHPIVFLAVVVLAGLAAYRRFH